LRKKLERKVKIPERTSAVALHQRQQEGELARLTGIRKSDLNRFAPDAK
jgi:hypothetical protein